MAWDSYQGNWHHCFHMLVCSISYTSLQDNKFKGDVGNVIPQQIKESDSQGNRILSQSNDDIKKSCHL